MSPRTPINDLQANAMVEGVYAVQNCQLGQTRNGKPFLKCLLCDRTGRAPGRMWSATQELFDSLPTDGFVHVQGQTQPYQGEMQIIIQNIKPVDQPTTEELKELIPCTDYDIDEMFQEVADILGWSKDPAIKALADVYLADDELMAKFKQAPAAMALHHAYLGGLLEHTLSLMRLGEAVCPLYREINRDLVVFGLFLHDLGKCDELTWQTGFGYSDDGLLVGHIARGMMWLEEKAKACAAAGTTISKPLLDVLQHIVLSHHGKPEFGALKIPATPEAVLVSLLDNVDAKTHMAVRATRDADGNDLKPGLGGNFTEKIWALETRLYRPDPTRIADDQR